MQLVIKILIILISISPAFALGEGNRNLLLIMAMGLSPLLLLRRLTLIPKIDVPIISLCFCLICFPLFTHPETMRWSTILYSCMFCLFFVSYAHILPYSRLPIDKYVNLLGRLIVAFSIVLVLQQICVLFGLPVINLSNYDPDTPWKLNSLSSEPSHSARFVAILMYSYLWMQDLLFGRQVGLGESVKKHTGIWLAFFWVMLTSGSGTAIMLLGIIFLRYINGRYVLRTTLLAVLLMFVLHTVEYEPIERVYRFFIAAITFDKNEMVNVDHSASLRLLPSITCIEHSDLTTLNGWTGHGVDYASNMLYTEIPGVKEGYSGGGYLLIALEYGFIPFLIITCFTLGICYHKKYKLQSVLLWLTCCLILGINMQIAWAFIIFSYTNKYFEHNLCSYRWGQRVADRGYLIRV